MKTIKDLLPKPHRLAGGNDPAFSTLTLPTYINFPPASLDDMEITHPKMQTVINAVRNWARLYGQGKKNSFVLVGPNGVGKTHITRAILWSIRLVEPVSGEERPAGRMYTAHDAIKILTESTPGVMAPVDRMNPSRSTPFVIIDDIGAEHDAEKQADWRSAHIQSLWFRLVDYCVRKDVPLILSASNNAGTIAGLSEHLGQRCWDRLLDMAPQGFIWDLSGVPSYRAKRSGRG